ncbi:MAG: zinc ribbon domain-containing protein [Dehalococcoidia bacterium]|jgi:predicted nucleic acid-binding Zn ribbon protein|nr:zinc ribbon domain-containing protein [Dehalococcoidia bacterium]
MFCKNCGKELIGTPEYCLNCGAKPLAAHSFCQNCGAAITPATEICVKCGAKVGEVVGETKGGKSKTTSVLLAVFLSFWTWLYTYRKDAWKFWVSLVLAIFTGILAVVTSGVSLVFSWIFNLGVLGVWIWAIVDTAVKKDEWYRSYS